MSLCDLCMAQVDRPGHFPPHAGLVKRATIRTATGGNAFVYRCEFCGEAMMLYAADDDTPDRWMPLKDEPGQ
jgi:hypothetical protein